MMEQGIFLYLLDKFVLSICEKLRGQRKCLLEKYLSNVWAEVVN